MGIFVACFVLGVVWRRGWGACPRRGGRGWDVWIVCGVFCFGGSVAFIGLGNMG